MSPKLFGSGRVEKVCLPLARSAVVRRLIPKYFGEKVLCVQIFYEKLAGVPRDGGSRLANIQYKALDMCIQIAKAHSYCIL